MEIQHGKEGIKSAQFNDIMGATSRCTLRLLSNSIPQEQQIATNYGIRGDALPSVDMKGYF
jgi:hypothetical protein